MFVFLFQIKQTTSENGTFFALIFTFLLPLGQGSLVKEVIEATTSDFLRGSVFTPLIGILHCCSTVRENEHGFPNHRYYFPGKTSRMLSVAQHVMEGNGNICNGSGQC